MAEIGEGGASRWAAGSDEEGEDEMWPLRGGAPPEVKPELAGQYAVTGQVRSPYTDGRSVHIDRSGWDGQVGTLTGQIRYTVAGQVSYAVTGQVSVP